MRKVKAGTVYSGKERYQAGEMLPDSVSEKVAAELEKQGIVESDKPKRSEPKVSKPKDEDGE